MIAASRQVLLAVLVALISALGMGCGSPAPQHAPDPGHDHPAHGSVWTCSMHPQVREDGPGTCPLCGMALVEVPLAAAEGDRSVVVDARIVQQSGIRTRRVARTTLYRPLRSLGEVVAPEDGLSSVSPRASGWLTDLKADTTGQAVRAGEVLYTWYSPSVVEAQQEMLLSPAGSSRRASARARLSRLGMAASDIDRVLRRGRAEEDTPVRAPHPGVVLELGAAVGTALSPAMPVMTLADLSTVWVEAEVYEPDAAWVERGLSATISLPGDPAPPREGVVSFVHPTLDPVRRTLRVRVEVPNPDGSLRPGQLATVQLGFRARPDVLVVPRDAVLDSGRRRLVFVHEGSGRFRPRAVRTGLSGDRDQVEILEGLHEGEEIVTSGLFLLDAEAQLQEAFRGLAPAQDAETTPTRWACPMHPEQVSDHPGVCGVCGMDLEPVPPPSDETTP